MKRKLPVAVLAAFIHAGGLFAQSDGFVNFAAADYPASDSLQAYHTQIHTGMTATGHAFSVVPEYPELVPVTAAEAKILEKSGLSKEGFQIATRVGTSRKEAVVSVSLVPFVFREGKWMRLVSCKLTLKSSSAARQVKAAASPRYADNSVLAAGRWVKIRVKDEGVYALTADLLASMGFSDPEHVRLYGYGGLILNEELDFTSADRVCDDLQEVPLYRHDGKLLFYSEGTIRWTKAARSTTWSHRNNTYSSYAYYFVTESNDAPAAFETIAAPAGTEAADCATTMRTALLDDDAYSWYEGGAEFYDSYDFSYGNSHTFSLAAPGAVEGETATVEVAFSASSTSSATQAEIALNGASLGTLSVPTYGSDENAREVRSTFRTTSLLGNNAFRFVTTSGNSARLNFIRVNYTGELDASDAPFSFCPAQDVPLRIIVSNATSGTRLWRLGKTDSPVAEMSSTLESGSLCAVVEDASRRYAVVDVDAACPQPEVVGEIANQNLHADQAQDMIILIPASRKLAEEAERLAEEHRTRQGLRVKVVSADQVYNEFSSGTPDAIAYKRYVKMLYDRAETSSDLPRYLLLFGDCLWDNRMLLAENRNFSPDDFLLAYETTGDQRSLGTLNSYVTDDIYAMLDDNEGDSLRYEMPDIAVGRFMCLTAEEAKIYVDKTIDYMDNKQTGAWKNLTCFLGDDIERNTHMEDAERAAQRVESATSEMVRTKRYYWDVYKRTTSPIGFSYPQMEELLREQMRRGALMFNYSGHGSPDRISHTKVLELDDFQSITSNGMPLWVFASCEIAPYDSRRENIARAAMLNTGGGAFAIICAARAVYATNNSSLNVAFCKHVFGKDDTGVLNTIGEALRLTKVELVTGRQDRTMNKLKYLLIGDPAVPLSVPTGSIVIDSINGTPLAEGETRQLAAGSKVRFSGYVVDDTGSKDETFRGIVTGTLFDKESTVTCQANDGTASSPMTYQDRGNALFEGNDSIRNGRFTLEAPIPYDISYSNETGRLYLYAVNETRDKEYHGYSDQYYLNGTDENAEPDTTGPQIYVALDDNDFADGGFVGTEALFLATISDDSGINTTGNGLGHDLELILDGNTADSYILNDYFSYDLGTYQRGQVSYTLENLTAGKHRLEFRAWDVNNNSSIATLNFTVKENGASGFEVTATNNPATTSTTFVAHVSKADVARTVTFEVYDLAGRRLWHKAQALAAGASYASAPWTLCDASGSALCDGIYLFRATCSDGKDEKSTDAQKIILTK